MSFKISIARPQVALHLRPKRLGACTHRQAAISESKPISKESSIQSINNRGYEDRIRMIIFSLRHSGDSKAMSVAASIICEMCRPIVFVAKLLSARILTAVGWIQSRSRYPCLWISGILFLYLLSFIVAPGVPLSLSTIAIIAPSTTLARHFLAGARHLAHGLQDHLSRIEFRLAESCAAVQAFLHDNPNADLLLASSEEKAKVPLEERRYDASPQLCARSDSTSSSCGVVSIRLPPSTTRSRSCAAGRRNEVEALRPCPIQTEDDFLKGARLKFGARRSEVLYPEFDGEGWLLVSNPNLNPEPIVERNGSIYDVGWKSIASR